MPGTVDPGKTRIVHCMKEPYDVYIGRWNPRVRIDSIWKNPFPMSKESDRQQVLRKYREYIMGRPDLLARLPELKGKTLGCWCKPRECHGDILVELIEKA